MTEVPASLVYKRGRVLRDATNGGGLISVDGQQYSFTLEQHWKSDLAPVVGAVIDAGFDSEGRLNSITMVSESGLAKEEFLRMVRTTLEKTNVLSKLGISVSGKLIGKTFEKFGVVQTLCLFFIFISWMFLTNFIIKAPLLGQVHYTFHAAMPFLNADFSSYKLNQKDGSFGIWSLLFYIALFLPFLPHKLEKRWAWLGYTAPLVFYVVAVGVLYSNVSFFFTSSQNQNQAIKNWGTAIAKATLNEFSFELSTGFYLSVIAAVLMAYKGISKFLALRPAGEPPVEQA
jgi:hypothetical protein